jgi:primosomal protein N' (replication factor Y)
MPKPTAASAGTPNTLLLRLAVPSPMRRLFDYLPPAELSREEASALTPGIRIKVPFGSRVLIAVLISIETHSNIALGKLRPALEILDSEPLLPDSLMKLYRWAAQYYQHPPGDVFQHMLPALLRQGLPPARQQAMAWRLTVEGLGLATDALKRAKRQREVIDFLQDHEELAKDSALENAISPSALSTLKKQGLIALLPSQHAQTPHWDSATNEASLPLNKEQDIAVSAVLKSLGAYSCFLLDGVTGSGKTEVYLQAISKVLSEGKQALVLVPEISLTPQTIARFRRRFSCPIALMHSGLTDNERLSAWTEAKEGYAPIVIGTRSALFTPLAKPGIIILDEEHDSSFKQQDGFRYSARDLAVVRARYEDVPIILGSATPSLESLHNALSGRFQHLTLTARAGNAVKPQLTLLDTSHEALQEGFSAPLLDLVAKHLRDGNQVLIFINRRGFSPTLQCNDCGWIAECRHCDARMTLHKSPAHLRCHHCDSRSAIPRSCPDCQSRNLVPLGLGTERSESLLTRIFPDNRVIRVDRDSTRRKNSLDALLNEVHQGLPCILVGTQMLAKGHHFPGVTLVAVLDADSGLFSADFRGQEHTGQLLMQVAGRAGREDKRGEVVIQTRHAAHQTLQTLTKEGYKAFALSILAERHASNMPPFSHLALLRSEASDFAAAEKLLLLARERILNLLEKNQESSILLMGPMPAPMERRANKFRAQLLLQGDDRLAMQALLAELCPELETLKESRTARWSIDIDPQDMI